MNRIYRALLLVVVAFSFFQCQKDISYAGEGDPIPVIPVINTVNPEPVNAHLQGNILDETAQPAAGVTITVGNKTATTDASGYFRITDAPLDKKSALVVAEKAGYFKGYRVFAATSGTNQVTIKLVKKALAGTVVATTGGEATLANGSKITLPANGVVVASSNAAYTGNIKVYAAYIDPTSTDISQTVPGSFAATDKNGSRVTLASYGMLAVVLESDAGEKLQIKDGSVSSLTTFIPTARQASAPATIALWSVDEQTGIWKEEGTATRQGNNYIGNVKHFSFWNCDQPMDASYLTMTLQTADSLPLVHAWVRITRSSTAGYFTSAYGITDSLGQVSGLVPANEPLVLEVLDPCFSAVYTQNLTALTQNTDLGIINVTSTTTVLNTFTGKLLDCSGAPVTNGYAIISTNNMVRYAATDSAGIFYVAFITCNSSSNTATVVGVDGAGQQQSISTTVALTSPLTDAGTITACGTSTDQYINYTVNDNINNTYYFINSISHDSITAYTSNQGSSNIVTYIMGDRIGYNNIYFTAIGANGIGTFPVGQLQVQYSNNVTLIPPFNVTFTKFPAAAGDFYEGSFSGSYTNNGSATLTINTTFRVKRSF